MVDKRKPKFWPAWTVSDELGVVAIAHSEKDAHKFATENEEKLPRLVVASSSILPSRSIELDKTEDAELDLRVLYCKDFFVASRYAADRNWWLHSWIHHTDDYAPDEVIEYRRHN